MLPDPTGFAVDNLENEEDLQEQFAEMEEELGREEERDRPPQPEAVAEALPPSWGGDTESFLEPL